MHPENCFMPKIPFWIFILLALVYFTAINVDTMDVDASQYAEMSREMLHSHNWLQLYDRGNEYLDKPPFLFWVSAASMKVFGVNNFGYKFPSILFALWALYAVYRLARLLYNESVGRLSALILGTCQGMFLMTNDIRTDTILMSWVITALWMIKEAELNRKWYYVLGGTASIAFGMMTKGPVALLVPMFSFGSNWVLKREWGKIFNPRHLLDTLLIGIFLIPMSIGLYQQFDQHPEKLVNGLNGVSGLRFFYWSQSFGRITGESPWNNGAGIDFLYVNMLWSFLPWILLFTAGLIAAVVHLFRSKFRLQPHEEFITTGGFLLTYLSLGMSKYQLPHYIFVVFPLAAIITAKFLSDFIEHKKYSKLFSVFKPLQVFVSVMILVMALLIILIVFPAKTEALLLWGLAAAVLFYIMLSKRMQLKFFWLCVAAIISGNIFFTNYFYKNLLQYQVGSVVGRYIHDHHIPADKVACFGIDDAHVAMHFYAQHIIAEGEQMLVPGNYILAADDGLKYVQDKGLKYDILKQGEYFKVTRLTGKFLNMATRKETLKNYYFILLK